MNLKSIKRLIVSNLGSFHFFYRYLRHRIFFALALSLFVAVLDGFGLAMFLPLLQQVDSSSSVGHTADGMGNLSFLIEGIEYIGLPFSLTTILVIMLIFFILKGVFKFWEGYYRVVNQRHFTKQIRFNNIDLLSNYSYKSFVLADSGRIQNTFSGEVERVITAYRSYFSATQYMVLVLVYIVLAFLANAQFAILVAVGGGLTNVIYKKIYTITKKLSREVTEMNHSFQGLLIQMVAFFKYLKATGSLTLYGNKLKRNILGIEDHSKKMGLLSSALGGMREPVIVTVVIIVILIQVNVMGQKLGLIILSLLFFYRSLSFLMAVQNYWNNYLGVAGSLHNMDEFTQVLKNGADHQGDIPFSDFENKVEFINVDFYYQKTRILNNISFEIHKNQTVAFVGESGSGKTTIMNLLAGLIIPDAGDVRIDNVSMKALNRNSFQQRIGYITQDPVIFNDTVYNNLTLWAPPTQENLERFYAVLKQAAIFEFIMELPEKEHALLGNNGISISGGQRQRLSIARELFKQVDFLFLDEATSALDSETERAIQLNIDALKGKYTILMIAHRLSTVRNADKIVLMSKGTIEAVGTFEELNAASGTFRRMVQFQEF
jgi:ABC-type multidrug transport system fused ATPase/permease subunit